MLNRILRQLLLSLISALLLPAAQAQVGNTPKAGEAVGDVIAASAVSKSAATAGSEMSSRPVIVVQEFAVSDKTGWPYDKSQLQSQTVAELRAKISDRLDVLVGAPETPRVHTYTLTGEVVSWRPGNRAKRVLVGMGSGRESAEIHYWLTDEQGKKIFEHKDTIRAEFWDNVYASSVGQLAHPFASKIVARLAETKLF